MRISFVIPCYRSEKTIEAVVKEIIDTVSLRDDDYEIIMVSDNSPDNVYSVIKRMCAENPKLKGAELAKNFGQHAALMAGYSMCDGDIVVSLDDDGQIPVDEVYSLIDKMNEGYDVVYGTYAEKQHSPFRNWGSRLNDKMAEALIGKPKNIRITSYYAAKGYVIKEMLNYDKAYPYVMGLVLRTTNRIGNVPVKHRKRQEGESGYTLKKLISLWMNGFTAFSVKPLRIATVLGVVCAFIGFVFGAYTVINKLVNPDVLMGYSSIMAVLLFIGGMIMLMLGLIGEYIGRMYISMNNSPQYVVRDTINMNKKDNIEV